MYSPCKSLSVRRYEILRHGKNAALALAGIIIRPNVNTHGCTRVLFHLLMYLNIWTEVQEDIRFVIKYEINS